MKTWQNFLRGNTDKCVIVVSDMQLTLFEKIQQVISKKTYVATLLVDENGKEIPNLNWEKTVYVWNKFRVLIKYNY
jgi:ligand-binding sensor protein